MASDLEEKLIKENWLSLDELLSAKQYQKKVNKSLFSSLIKLSCLTERDVFRFFSLNSRVALVNISDYAPNSRIMNLLSEGFYRENLVYPLFKVEANLYIAMANPLDADLLTSLSQQTGLDVRPLLAPPGSILKALDDYFGPPQDFFQIEGLLFESQGLNKYPLYRETKRLPLVTSAEIKVDDERVKLMVSGFIPAAVFDISEDGRAVGVKLLTFLPSTTRVAIRFTAISGSPVLKGEVIYSKRGRRENFLVGVKFIDSPSEFISQLLSLARK